MQYLIVKDEYEYVEIQRNGNEIDQTGFKYTMYLKNGALTFTPTGRSTQPDSEEFKGTEKEIYVDKIKYEVESYVHNLGIVQAQRIGVFEDDVTFGNTYVSTLDVCFPYLEKQMLTNSKMDLIIHLLVHPEKAQYVGSCPDRTCKGGVHNTTGETCGTCNGSGKEVPASTEQQVNSVMLPKDISNAIPLDKYIHYFTPPVDGVQLLIDTTDSYSEKAYRIRYNSETYTIQDKFETAYNDK